MQNTEIKWVYDKYLDELINASKFSNIRKCKKSNDKFCILFSNSEEDIIREYSSEKERNAAFGYYITILP